MDRVSDVQVPGQGDASALLQGVSAQPPHEVADRLQRVLGAAGTAASDTEARELDAAAVRALSETIQLDLVLEGVEPARLAELLRRATSRLQSGGETDDDARELVWAILDVVRRPAMLRKLDAREVQDWARLILESPRR